MGELSHWTSAGDDPAERGCCETPFADPSVTIARLLAEATRAKKQASDALALGDVASAMRLMTDEASKLRRARQTIDGSLPNSEELRGRLSEEEQQLDKLARGVHERDAGTSRKSFMEDVAMESRGRNDQTRRQRSRDKREF